MAEFDLEFVIHQLMPLDKSVGELMRSLIDAHAKEYPDRDWSPFYEIDFDQEAIHLQQKWFPQVIESEPPASVQVAGMYFGLFQPSL